MNAGVTDDAENPPLTITIGIDGRLYFPEMTPELLAVAQTLCPQDSQLTARTQAARMLRHHEHSCRQTGSREEAGSSNGLGRA